MTLSQRYELQGEIGRGVSAVVYRALDRETGRLVAVKIVAPRGAPDAEPAGSAAVRGVDHPGVIEVLERIHGPEGNWVVMELAPGGSLEQLLRGRRRIAIGQVVTWLAQAARTLAFAHARGVLHRDVKPANLLLADDGTLKLADFGAAAGPAGTPNYAAPECLADEPADGRSDLYSLGVVLYRCLAGRLPHRATNPEQLLRAIREVPPPPPSRFNPDVGPELDAACMTALAAAPQDRFGDGLSFAQALEEAAAAAPGEIGRAGDDAAPDDPMDQTAPPGARSEGDARWWIAAAALAGATLGLAQLATVRPASPVTRPASVSAPVARPAPVSAPAPRPVRAPAAVLTAPPEPPAPREPASVTARPARTPGQRPRPVAPAPPVAAARREPPPVREPLRPAPGAAPGPVARAAVPAIRAGGQAAPPATTVVPAPATVVPAPTPATDPPAATPAAAPPARGRIELAHGLPEGLVELRIDGRRREVRRFRGDGSVAVPLLATFTVEPGEHVVGVRLLSAGSRVEAETTWRESWGAGELRSRRLRLSREGDRAALVTESDGGG
ncbi:MAG: protein kinase [Acidobacteria bacterium]|nr:protein kinase [Acidobacteriota bacterium]